MESPLVCDILPHADPNTGLMPEGIMDFLEDKPRTPVDPEKLAEALDRYYQLTVISVFRIYS